MTKTSVPAEDDVPISGSKDVEGGTTNNEAVDSAEDTAESESQAGGSLFANSVSAFVETFARVHYEAEYPKAKWCNAWEEHPQANLIFEGLWRSYEEARAADMANAGGQSTMNYLVGHFYPMMDRLTGHYGPFVRCSLDSCGGPIRLGEKRDRAG